MTKPLDPRHRVVQPFTDEDNEVFYNLYGLIPVKDMLPMMTYEHPLESMYGHANILDVSKRVPFWTVNENKLTRVCIDLGLTYAEVSEKATLFSDVRELSVASITQHLYRIRKSKEHAELKMVDV